MTSTGMTVPRPIALSLSQFQLPYATITLVVFIVAWEVIARLTNLPTYLLPTPTEVFNVQHKQRETL